MTTVLLAADDGGPQWLDMPADLVVTLTATDRRGWPALAMKSTDGDGFLTAGAGGVLDIAVPAANMTVFQNAGRYDLHLKIELDGSTLEFPWAILNIHEGAP